MNHNLESAREFGNVQMPDERIFELSSYRAWELGQATAIDGRKAVAHAGQRKGVVADCADHVFRLPQVFSGDAAARVECIQPGQTDDFLGCRRRNMPRLIRLSEHKLKRWS